MGEEPYLVENTENDNMKHFSLYSKNCLKRPLKNKTKIDFRDRLLHNAGLKYCRILQEHSAILLTFIQLPFVI